MTHSDNLRTLLTKLAIGLLQQQSTKPGRHNPATVLNTHIRHGWEMLVSACFQMNLQPPVTLSELVQWLHTPVERWNEVGEQMHQLGFSGRLLQDGLPTDLAFRLGEPFANTYNPKLELEDVNFRELFAICEQAHDNVLYSQVREFINRNPIVFDFYEQITGNLAWNGEVRALLSNCYETIPEHCIRQIDGNQLVARCPHCGWVLSWRYGEAFCHPNGPCAEIRGNLSEPDDFVVYQPIAMARTREGVQRYVVAPEVTLMKLYDTLMAEWGITCELYPELDAYDLLVTLPNGQKWAVDMKDWRQAEGVAMNVGTFPYIPQWHRAFYVFPDYRTNQSGYLPTFNNYWTPQKDVTPISYRNFLRQVHLEIGQ